MCTVEIPLTQGQVALIDRADLVLVAPYKWFAHKRHKRKPSDRDAFYAHANTTVDGARRTVLMHRLIAGFPNEDVDHRNGNGLDNRRENLRAATPNQNGGNAMPRRNETSRFKGVSWFAESSCWMANITHERRQRYLGLHATEEAAALAYNSAARELFGEFARLNEI